MIPKNIKPGDLIGIKRKRKKLGLNIFAWLRWFVKGGWWPWLVYFATKSDITHIAIYIGDGQVVEAIQNDKVRIASFPEHEEFIVGTAPLTDKQREDLVKWAKSQVGRKYSWLQFVVAGMKFLGKLRDLFAWIGLICSSFATIGHKMVDFLLLNNENDASLVVSPGEVMMSPILTLI